MTRIFTYHAGIVTWWVLTAACLGVGEERFFGGSFDGYSTSDLIANPAAAEGEFLRFSGGGYDGYGASDAIANPAAAEGEFRRFSGGGYDGYSASDAIANPAAAEGEFRRFSGGGYDGYSASDAIANPAAAEGAFRRFSGGGYDGYSASDAIANPAAAEGEFRRFSGGGYDGYSASDAIANPIGTDAASRRFTGGGYDGYADASVSVTRFFPGRSDLLISKLGPSTNVAGTALSYTLVVSNQGPTRAINVQLRDTPPAGIVLADPGPWDLGDLEPGVSTSVVVMASSDPATLGMLTNHATVSSDTFDPDLFNNTSMVQTVVSGQADLSASLSAPVPVVAGEGFLLTLTVSNRGPSRAETITSSIVPGSGLSFLDLFPPSFASLAPGESASAELSVSAAPDMVGTVTAAVSVTASTPDPSAADNTGQVVILILREATLSLVKSGPVSALAGAEILYSLTVSNAGPSDAVNLRLEDDLPTELTANGPVGFDLPRIRPGETAQRHVRARSGPGFRGLVTNTARVASDLTVPHASAFTSIRGAADLSLVKTGDEELLDTNVIEYLLVVSNAGPTQALDLRVTDRLPAGLTLLSAGSDPACQDLGTSVICRVASLPAGGVTGFLLRVEVDRDLTRTLTNRAMAVSADPDAEPGNNADSAVTVLVNTDGDTQADFADPDDDNDRITDDWEKRYGLNPRDAADASLDGDGDRMSNLAEFFADTHPGLGTDFLHISGFDLPGLMLQFPSKGTRQYRVHGVDIVTGAYADLGLEPVPGNDLEQMMPVPRDLPLFFFRIVPEPKP